MSTAELTAEMVRLSKLLDDALDYLKRATREWAEAEDAYRCAHARVFLMTDGPQGDKKATADAHTSEQRRRAHLADGMRQAALEAVRSRRAQLSALQTIANAIRAEIDMARTGPLEGAA